jgi:uncharacterized protein (TIGR03083 family)
MQNQDEERAWQAIRTQRLAVADLLESLDAAQWQQPSLCEGWTVQDVAAHLTLQEVSVLDGLRMVVRSPGGMNQVIRQAARRRAAGSSRPELVAAIRASADRRRHNAGLSCLETLVDALVHSQDIARPLGRTLPVPPDAAALAAAQVWRKGWPFYPRRRLAGLRLVATDSDWAAGDGREIRGTIGDLLLVLTGRAAAVLDDLDGDGVPELRRRLALTTTSRGS